MQKQFIPRRKDRPSALLSFAQQRLWFFDQLEPNSYVYNSPRAWRLIGKLKVDAWQHALEAIVSRHEAIRTTFVQQDESPIQVIGENRTVELPIVDLSSLKPSEREAELQRLLCAEAQRPFDLNKDLMLRARLFRLGEDDHVFLCTMHHIATDGWSLNVLFEDLAAFYNAYSSNTPASLP